MLNNRIRYYRKKYGITQEQLGEKINKTKQDISRIELNKVQPGIELALKIVQAFKDITKEKSKGKQQLQIHVDDLFYLDN